MKQQDFQNMTPFQCLHAQIEGSDIETQADSLAINNLIKKRDQMCSEFTIGKGINPESVEKMKRVLEEISRIEFSDNFQWVVKLCKEALTASSLK